MTTWLRHEFEAPALEPGERLAILLCADDGAVVYLNGQEVDRLNMPKGRIDAGTLAQQTVDNNGEGFYSRLRVPAAMLRAQGRNAIAVEVHQASPGSSDLFFDLELKVVPAAAEIPPASAAARQAIDAFNRLHYLGPGVAVPDGFIDGGRHMKLDAEKHAESGREILWVDRVRDKQLADDLAYVSSAEFRALPVLERAKRIAARIDGQTTPPGGLKWIGETARQLEAEFKNQPLLIGDWVEQCHAGVCRHRSLLFKILADEAGLKTSLVRGNYLQKDPPGIPHAWNEVVLDDGHCVLVDVMHSRGEAKFPALTDRLVVAHYRKVDGTPWYRSSAD